MKNTGIILLVIGVFLLAGAILVAMSVGGIVGTILLIGSIAVNSAAVMMLTSKK